METGEEILLRPAGEGDYPGIHTLYLALHRQHLRARPDIYRDADPLPGEAFLEALQDDNHLFLVAAAGERVAGICELSLRSPQSPLLVPVKSAFIEALAVSEDFRRQGVGARLFSRAKEFAKERGARRLSLNVWPFNEGAIAFYRRMGLSTQRLSMEGEL